ncbi:MAG: hypothetical protein J5649_11080 [Lachnospiraceae bacterium]|nr:hypothetical protein [Lachnospiraceae bacterium]
MINKLERKFGRYAIKGLMKYIVLLYGLGLIMFFVSPQFYYNWLALDIEKTFLHFQLWRLITFLIQPIEQNNIFFVLITMYLYYFIGNMLEMKWGSFRFNLFYFSGVLFNILMCVVVYLFMLIVYGTGISVPVSLEYINLAMLFAFAVEFGDVQMLLFFVIPIKVKYLGMFVAAMYGYAFISVFIKENFMSFLYLFIPFVIGIMNFLIFWFVTRKARRAHKRTVADMRRRYMYMQGVRTGEREGTVVNQAAGRKVITRHRCAVCGRTELDDDMLEFRFCSKCEGNYEYCMDHLYTHTHVVREKTGSGSVDEKSE